MADHQKAARPPRSPADALLARSLSAFHATALFVLLVAVAHRAASLGSTLAGIGTVGGIALFLALWATTSWTTHRALDSYSLADAKAEPWPAFIEPATKWGGVNGVAFLFAYLLVRTAQIATSDQQPVLGALGINLLFLVAGALPAVIVGAVIGVVFGLIDRSVLGLGIALARSGSTGSPNRPI